MKKINLEYRSWDYTCSDGCCTDYGIEVYLNGEILDHPDNHSDYDMLSNAYIGECPIMTLRAVFKRIGYPINFSSEKFELYKTNY